MYFSERAHIHSVRSIERLRMSLERVCIGLFSIDCWQTIQWAEVKGSFTFNIGEVAIEGLEVHFLVVFTSEAKAAFKTLLVLTADERIGTDCENYRTVASPALSRLVIATFYFPHAPA